MLSQTEVVFCDATVGYLDCFGWCNPSGTDCSKGLKVSQRVITRIGDVTLDPDKWKFELNWTMSKQVGWGNSFVPDDEDGDGTVDWIYIYGARQTPTRTDAVIARATPANITNPRLAVPHRGQLAERLQHDRHARQLGWRAVQRLRAARGGARRRRLVFGPQDRAAQGDRLAARGHSARKQLF